MPRVLFFLSLGLLCLVGTGCNKQGGQSWNPFQTGGTQIAPPPTYSLNIPSMAKNPYYTPGSTSTINPAAPAPTGSAQPNQTGVTGFGGPQFVEQNVGYPNTPPTQLAANTQMSPAVTGTSATGTFGTQQEGAGMPVSDATMIQAQAPGLAVASGGTTYPPQTYAMQPGNQQPVLAGSTQMVAGNTAPVGIAPGSGPVMGASTTMAPDNSGWNNQAPPAWTAGAPGSTNFQ